MSYASPTSASRNTLSVVVPDFPSNPNTLQRSKTPTSRKPLRSSPLAGPAVVSLNDTPTSPNPSPNLLSPPLSVHLRSKSKSAQSLARPVSLYSYSYAYSPGDPTSSGHNKRPSTAPGLNTDMPKSKRFSLGSFSASSLRSPLDTRNAPAVPQRPSSALVSPITSEVQQQTAIKPPTAAAHPSFGPSARAPEGISPYSDGRNNGNDLAVPGSFLAPPPPSGGGAASSHVRYSYAASVSPNSRPVSFAADSNTDAEARRARRASYHPSLSPSPSSTPKPILKHSSSSRASFIRPHTPPSSSSASLPSPTSPSSLSSNGSEPASSTSKRVTTRLSGAFKDDGTWYTLSPYATTPKFSRLGLSAPGVVMPVSAKDMAKRNSGVGVSRGASVRSGHHAPPNSAGPGQSAGKRAPMIGDANVSAAGPGTPGAHSGAPPAKKHPQAQTPEWLSVPPPARGGDRGRSRGKSRGSLKSLHDALQTQSQSQQPSTTSSSSLTRSSTSSAASSSSSLRSSLTSFGGGKSSTSTSRSTPVSSPSTTPSTLSLRSWRSSMKASLSLSSAAGSGTPQSPSSSSSDSAADSTSASSPSVSPSSSVLESEETAKARPPAFTGRESEERIDDPNQGKHRGLPASTDDVAVDTGTSRLKKRKSASALLLARVKSWRWTGSGNGNGGGKRDGAKKAEADVGMGVDFGENEGEGEGRERGTRVKEVEVAVPMIEVKEETPVAVAVFDIEVQQEQEQEEEAQKDNEEEGEDKAAKLELNDDGDGSPPDSKERHCDDQTQNEEVERECAERPNLVEDAEEGHGHPATAEAHHISENDTPTPTSIPDPNPEPEPEPEAAPIAATLIVVPIPSPNLHVAATAGVPIFIEQVAEAEADAIQHGELNSISGSVLTASQYTQEHALYPAIEVVGVNMPLSHSTANRTAAEDLAPAQTHAPPQTERQIQTKTKTHKRSRRGSMRKLWGAIIGGAGAGKPAKTAAEPMPVMPDIGKERE